MPRMRAATIAQQKERGRKSLAVLPIHYPKALLTALDVHAVELWGPPGPPAGPAVGRVQTYVCAVVRNALAFLAAGKADAVDGVLFPHTCDSIQGLATLAPDFGGWDKKVFTFLHPKGPRRPSARTFVEAELRSLAGELEAWTGRSLEPGKLSDAIALHAEIDAQRASLLRGRRRLAMSDRALYTLLRRGEFLWPEDHLAELEGARAALGDSVAQTGLPVMITGYVPEPMSLFDSLESAGAFVVVDDYAAVGRRLQPRPPTRDADPFTRLADAYFDAPPCPTRSADQGDRMRHLAHLFERSEALGVIVHELKFCEPELFDVPAIKKTFASRDVPLLYLEGELERELSGQTVTRIEAFVEMLEPRRLAAAGATSESATRPG